MLGSSDVERSFSILNHIRNSRRHRLTPESLNNLMRIRLNGPAKLSKFNSMKYAKYWVNKQLEIRVDDEVRKREIKDNDYEYRENFIYFDESSIF